MLGCVARGAVVGALGVAFTGEGLGKGGWPGSSFKPLRQHPLLQPTQGIPWNLPAYQSLSSTNTVLCPVSYPERAVGDGGICLLSPAFLWAPDSQEPWPLLLPAGTPLPLAQYWARSRPLAETPGIGLISLSLEPEEIWYIWAEKSSSLAGGKRRGSQREAVGLE